MAFSRRQLYLSIFPCLPLFLPPPFTLSLLFYMNKYNICLSVSFLLSWRKKNQSFFSSFSIYLPILLNGISVQSNAQVAAVCYNSVKDQRLVKRQTASSEPSSHSRGVGCGSSTQRGAAAIRCSSSSLP